MDAILVKLREHAAFIGHPNVDHDKVSERMMAWCDSLRSRLRTQRERLAELKVLLEKYADPMRGHPQHLRDALAALDSILKEEGP